MDSLPSDYFVKSMQFTPHNRQAIYSSIDPANPANNLSGKVAIITGASRGLGAQGLAPMFAKTSLKGMVLVATNADKLSSVEKSVNEAYPQIETLVVAANISDPASVASLFEKVKDKFGHADILINNAAVLTGGGNIHEEDPVNWWKNFEVNTFGNFLLAQNFIKSLPDPNSTPGTIVTVVTGGAWGIFPAMSGYANSKLAALQLNTYIDAAYPNITTVSLHPGLMETDMLLDTFRRFNLDPPEFVASVVMWLTFEKAKFMSGRAMVVNWDVDELVQRKEEILEKDLLKMKLNATLGPEQFE